MRKSYRGQFYNIFFKKCFQEIPKILAVTLVVAILSAGIIVGISMMFGDDINQLTVAYVFEEEDSFFSVSLKYMANSANCKFKKYNSEKSALRALKDQEVIAILIVNNGEDDVNENSFSIGSSLPVNSMRFIYYDDNAFITAMFSKIVGSGISDYLVLNSTRDAVRATYTDYSRADLSKLEDDLMDYLMHRNRYYERIVFYDSGDIPLKYYYAGNAIALILLLSASVVIGFTKNDDENFILFARQTGISWFDIFHAKYLPVSVFYSAVALISSLVLQYGMYQNITIESTVSSVIATILLLSAIVLIHEIISDKTISVLCSILVSIVAMFLSGNIIPLTFLPEIFEKVSPTIFTNYPCKLYGQIVFGRMNNGTIITAVIILAIMYIINLSVAFVRGKNNGKSN